MKKDIKNRFINLFSERRYSEVDKGYVHGAWQSVTLFSLIRGVMVFPIWLIYYFLSKVFSLSLFKFDEDWDDDEVKVESLGKEK